MGKVYYLSTGQLFRMIPTGYARFGKDEEAHVKLSIDLLNAWAFGDRYCLVRFQNAVMLKLLQTLEYTRRITPEIVLTAYYLPMREGGYKVRPTQAPTHGYNACGTKYASYIVRHGYGIDKFDQWRRPDTYASPVRTAALNAALCNWLSPLSGLFSESERYNINALAQHRDCLSDFVDAAVKSTHRQVGMHGCDTVYGSQLYRRRHREEDVAMYMLADDDYDVKDTTKA